MCCSATCSYDRVCGCSESKRKTEASGMWGKQGKLRGETVVAIFVSGLAD